MRRRTRVLGLFAGAVLAACGDESGSKGISGTYRATTERGSQTITIDDKGDTIVLGSDGDTAEARRTAEGKYEGSKTEAEGTLRFTIERRGSALAVRYVLTTPDGTTQELPELVYAREAEPTSSAAPHGPADVAGDRPAALVGHWRYTWAKASADLSIVTDYHLVLEADGTCRTWSHTEGNTSNTEPETRATWKVENKTLFTRAESGGDWAAFGRYAVDGARLMITFGNGNKRVYERI